MTQKNLRAAASSAAAALIRAGDQLYECWADAEAARAYKAAVDLGAALNSNEPFVCEPGEHRWESNPDPLGLPMRCPRCTSECYPEHVEKEAAAYERGYRQSVIDNQGS